mgnify:CR=1 FL=1
MKYIHKKLDIATYIKSLYEEGLKKSDTLSDATLENIILNIGIFKFKGYVKAFRGRLPQYKIDDVINLYNLDRAISLNMMSLTSQIEIKLKSIVIGIVYSLTENPFFYLLKESYNDNFTINNESIYDWEVKTSTRKAKSEIYLHYRDYYLVNYDFEENKKEYLAKKELIDLNSDLDINYPPFHYFVENMTLGVLIRMLSKLTIDGNSILKLVANHFSIYNPNVFLNYLLRLKELRNRCAHNGRIINRNYRGLKAIEKHKGFRKTIYEHKLIDVYYTLHFLLDNSEQFKTVENLIDKFKEESLNGYDDNLKDFVISFMKTR